MSAIAETLLVLRKARPVGVTAIVGSVFTRWWFEAAMGSDGAVLLQPVPLTESAALPPSTAAALDRLAPVRRVAVERLAGASRFQTAALVAETASTAGASVADVWVATGRAFPDALAAGAAVGATRGVLLLVDGPGPDGAADAGAFLTDHRPGLEAVHLLGGPAAVSEEVAEALRAVVG